MKLTTSNHMRAIANIGQWVFMVGLGGGCYYYHGEYSNLSIWTFSEDQFDIAWASFVRRATEG